MTNTESDRQRVVGWSLFIAEKNLGRFKYIQSMNCSCHWIVLSCAATGSLNFGRSVSDYIDCKY